MDATRASCTSGTISLRTRLGFVFRLRASWVELRTGLPSSSAWPSRSMALSALENVTSSMLVPHSSAGWSGWLPTLHISNSYSCIFGEVYVLFKHAYCDRSRWPHEAGHRPAPQREPEHVMSAEHEIREIVSRYTRAADQRDGEELEKIYEADAVVEIHYRGPDGMESQGSLAGGVQIAAAMSKAMALHPPLGWSHHTTYDHLVS